MTEPTALLFFPEDISKLLPRGVPVADTPLGHFRVLSHFRKLEHLEEFVASRREEVRESHEPLADVVIAQLGSSKETSGLALAKHIRKHCSKSFVVVFSRSGASSPALRMGCLDAGCNMVTHSPQALQQVLDQITSQCRVRHALRNAPPGPPAAPPAPGTGPLGRGYACPSCRMRGLSEDLLVVHGPLYHCNEPATRGARCPVCSREVHGALWVHIHTKHGPIGRGEEHSPDVGPRPPLYAFALVVCRNPASGKYLVVQEFCNKGFWLPGGGVDCGEDLQQAALRETMEEAGVLVDIKGLLRMEHRPSAVSVRLRVVFYAEPVDEAEAEAKSTPDYESVGAVWASVADLRAVRLRGPEPLQWAEYLEAGGLVSPLSLLTSERAPVHVGQQPFSVV